LRNLIKNLFFIFFLLVIFWAGFLLLDRNKESTEKAQAQSSSRNLSGWVWNSNIGWINFNSKQTNGKIDYGVHICTSDGDSLCNSVASPKKGKLTGWAWSPNIGWIKFDPSFSKDGEQGAWLDQETNEIHGWARACAGTVNGDCNSPTRTDGWDGWIKMAGKVVQAGQPVGIYAVAQSSCQFHGFAWGSNVLGWTHFRGPHDYPSSQNTYSLELTDLSLCSEAPSDLTISEPKCVSNTSSVNIDSIKWLTHYDGDTIFELERDTDENFTHPTKTTIVVPNARKDQWYSTGPGGANGGDYGLSPDTTYYYRLRAKYGEVYTGYTKASVKTPQCGEAEAILRAQNLETGEWDDADINSYGRLMMKEGKDFEISWCRDVSHGAKPTGGIHECNNAVSCEVTDITDPNNPIEISSDKQGSYLYTQNQFQWLYKYQLECRDNDGLSSYDEVTVKFKINPRWVEEMP